MINILEFTLERLARIFDQEFGKGRFHAHALYRDIFKQGNENFFVSPEFLDSPRFAKALKGKVSVAPGEVVKTVDEGELTKFITRLHDGLEIESVVIPMTRHNTLCISSQVGCKMGCKFCETGRMGFKRNLSISEIVGQVYNARHRLKKDVKNIVFMGMGEPLDNFDNLMGAIGVMNEQQGFDIALRHMTLSTVGLVPGIERLARLAMAGLRLAVSINAPDDATRSLLMPINTIFPLAHLKKSLINFPLPRRGVFLFEYILIRGLNDSPAHADLLADFIHPLPVRLNLIAYNPVKGLDHESPSDDQMHVFADLLSAKGIMVIKRWSRGRSVAAGCGQLGRNT
ncbi:MAG: 23S rRNA (adenine(2503)-C(2))-methyltransferase RlmN [Proteobacteria bacterium]|nr:23S rRNA (adenine(2503)-C(2))-methyltransferase RlmN [Desulfobacula sp.]MBU3952397.1 23S rRNA (adenine(2503)-C(2))-methyltransferase RlmN [Pseudomonadota bacterium]MBU4129985.1 23S rRNA (adenine(2503)-C(2))-methyltransferase RlmN [Pseudomonadota bacterium]